MAPSTDSDTRVLKDLIASTRALLVQFLDSLDPSNGSTPQPIEKPPHPLRLLGDSSKLVKAHTTKLSLLAITKPFTPSAITKVLKELAGTCLPAMMSAVQICEQEKATWGTMMSREVQMRARRMFREMEVLLKEVLSIAEGNEGSSRRDSLNSTGIVWESCDALTELEKLGIAGLALQKVEQYRETIKDAIEEIQDWAEGEALDTEGHSDGLLDSDDEGVDGDRNSIEDIFNAPNSMPKDRPELKALADDANSKLKKVVILYNALEKRRIATFVNAADSAAAAGAAATMSPVKQLDEVMLHLKKIPHQIDEMAGYFYDLDDHAARGTLEKCLTEAKSAAAKMETSWDGSEDAFTTWLRKWETAVGSNKE